MKDRIKQIRKEKKLGQTDFAKELGISASSIQSYELGRRIPSEAFIHLICEKYKIREAWLRDGSGEMYEPYARDEEIADITAELYKDESLSPEDIKDIIKLVETVIKLPQEKKDALLLAARTLLKNEDIK